MTTQRNRTQLGGKRVALIDADSLARFALSSMLQVRYALAEVVTTDDNFRLDMGIIALVVLDPFFDSLGALRVARVRKMTPSPILALTSEAQMASVESSFAAGVHGYVLKEGSVEDLDEALDTVMGGGRYLQPSIGAEIAARSQSRSGSDLTGRQTEILRLIAMGFTNPQIAETLVVSVRTIESHRAALTARLGVSSRAELVEAAKNLDLA